jgi:hypothetical protein
MAATYASLAGCASAPRAIGGARSARGIGRAVNTFESERATQAFESGAATDDDAVLACLRAASLANLTAAAAGVVNTNLDPFTHNAWNPTVDGVAIPEDPLVMVQKGLFSNPGKCAHALCRC